MLTDYINEIKSSYDQFVMGGMYFALFLVAMLYIFLKEKDKKIKMFFICFPIIAFLVIVNPIFYKFLSPAFSVNTYNRMFWILPIGIEIAYASILLISEEEKKSKKIITFIGIIIIIALSGNFYFHVDDGSFREFGNLYKLPDESVLVAQLIGIDEEENKKALVPADLVPYIRQIDASIELLYGREPDTAYWNNPYATELDNGNVEYIVKILEKNNCQYVVYRRATVMREPIENYGYEMINETTNYVIYKKVRNV